MLGGSDHMEDDDQDGGDVQERGRGQTKRDNERSNT